VARNTVEYECGDCGQGASFLTGEPPVCADCQKPINASPLSGQDLEDMMARIKERSSQVETSQIK